MNTHHINWFEYCSNARKCIKNQGNTLRKNSTQDVLFHLSSTAQASIINSYKVDTFERLLPIGILPFYRLGAINLQFNFFYLTYYNQIMPGGQSRHHNKYNHTH